MFHFTFISTFLPLELLSRYIIVVYQDRLSKIPIQNYNIIGKTLGQSITYEIVTTVKYINIWSWIEIFF